MVNCAAFCAFLTLHFWHPEPGLRPLMALILSWQAEGAEGLFLGLEPYLIGSPVASHIVDMSA